MCSINLSSLWYKVELVDVYWLKNNPVQAVICGAAGLISQSPASQSLSLSALTGHRLTAAVDRPPLMPL